MLFTGPQGFAKIGVLADCTIYRAVLKSMSIYRTEPWAWLEGWKLPILRYLVCILLVFTLFLFLIICSHVTLDYYFMDCHLVWFSAWFRAFSSKQVYHWKLRDRMWTSVACYVPSHFSYAIHICSFLVKLQYKASLLLHETVNIFEVRLKVVVVVFFF